MLCILAVVIKAWFRVSAERHDHQNQLIIGAASTAAVITVWGLRGGMPSPWYPVVFILRTRHFCETHWQCEGSLYEPCE